MAPRGGRTNCISPTSPVLDSNAFSINSINVNPAIGVGQYVTRTNTFTLPIEPSGDYYLILKVDAFGFADIGAVQESNESNNVAVTQIHILNPDLVPTSLVAPAVAGTDQTIPLQWSEMNQGDGVAANPSFQDGSTACPFRPNRSLIVRPLR